MQIRSYVPIFTFVAAVFVLVLAFHKAPEAPRVEDPATFIPRTEAVQWMALGHRSTVASLFWIQGLVSYGEGLLTGRNFQWVTHLADASTRLDSLFKTPYTFVAAVTPISEADTSDFPVLRRGIAKYPQDWQMALSFSLRLAEGPTHDYQQAARIMEHFAHDTTVLPHVRTLHRSFYLRTQTTEMALMMVLEDCMNPNYNGYRSSLVAKAARALGRDPRNSAEAAPVWRVMDKFFKQQLSFESTLLQLLAMKQTP